MHFGKIIIRGAIVAEYQRRIARKSARIGMPEISDGEIEVPVVIKVRPIRAHAMAEIVGIIRAIAADSGFLANFIEGAIAEIII